MLKLEDKITIAIAGPIKSGKNLLAERAPGYSEILFQSLSGNFWVSRKLEVIREDLDPDLFERYSSEPKRYAFEFQGMCLANRLAQQDQVDRATGLMLVGQPLEIDRWVYAEANRENLGESFRTYEHLYGEVEKRVHSPDLWVYLRVPEDKVEILLNRIRAKGRPGEKKFLEDPSYLLENIRRNELFFREKVRQPVITIDATHQCFDGQTGKNKKKDEANFKQLYRQIAAEVKKYSPAPRLTLDEWEAVDHNRAQKGAREARRQLRDYLIHNLTIVTLAGNVGVGKTGMAELINEELEIAILRELSGKNDEIKDGLLAKFLRDKKSYAYALQEYLLPKRLDARKEMYSLGKSFVEDRSPVEDQCIFWRRFHQQGYLTDYQLRKLINLAKKAYANAPPSQVLIQLLRSPRECRKLILSRGREEEIAAWPEEELKAMEAFQQGLFVDMEQYHSHQGPKIQLDLAEFDSKNVIHQGYLWQEMLHGLMELENPAALRNL